MSVPPGRSRQRPRATASPRHQETFASDAATTRALQRRGRQFRSAIHNSGDPHVHTFLTTPGLITAEGVLALLRRGERRRAKRRPAPLLPPRFAAAPGGHICACMATGKPLVLRAPAPARATRLTARDSVGSLTSGAVTHRSLPPVVTPPRPARCTLRRQVQPSLRQCRRVFRSLAKPWVNFDQSSRAWCHATGMAAVAACATSAKHEILITCRFKGAELCSVCSV